jgi:hypothetical protein
MQVLVVDEHAVEIEERCERHRRNIPQRTLFASLVERVERPRHTSGQNYTTSVLRIAARDGR